MPTAAGTKTHPGDVTTTMTTTPENLRRSNAAPTPAGGNVDVDAFSEGGVDAPSQRFEAADRCRLDDGVVATSSTAAADLDRGVIK